jgi:hypothetical protein
MESQGYEVIRLSAEKMMLDQVRELCSKITEIQSAFKRRGLNSKIQKRVGYYDLSPGEECNSFWRNLA